MSTTQHPLSSTAVPQTTSWWKRFLFPVIVLLVCGSLFALPWIWVVLDLPPAMPIFMLLYLAPLLAMVLLGVWWLFFSGVSWLAAIGFPVVIVLGVGIACFASVNSWEFTLGYRGLLLPRLHFVWDPTPDDLQAQFLAKGQLGKEAPPIDQTVGPEDFPCYRGINRDGVVTFAKLQTDWNKYPPTLLWKHPSPGGYSGVAVAKNIVVTLEQRKNQETVVCYDRATGQQRWAYSYDAFYKDRDRMGNGPRSTPTIHDKFIYSVGATGELVCLSVEGKKEWSVNILTDNKAKNIRWGLTGSPLIVDDLVVVNPGIDIDLEVPAGASLVAYDRIKGTVRWKSGNRRAGYSSPQLATFANQKQILLFDGDGLAGFDPVTGKQLWTTPWETKFDMNIIQPLVFSDDRVFISSDLENGSTMFRIKKTSAQDGTKWEAEPLWHNKGLCTRFANPVTDGKVIYGLHGLQGRLMCLNASDGSLRWEGERYKNGQMLLADGVLIIVNDDGEVRLVAADPAEYKELARYSVFEDKTWNTPALAGDQLFLRNQAEIACVRLPRRQ